MKTIKCYCEKEIEIDIEEQINLAENPEIKDKILDGTFMSFKCGNCGKLLKIELPVRIFDKSSDLDLMMIPEVERDSFLMGQKKYKNKKIVIGYPELAEKIILLDNNLDDRIIEIIKFYIISKLNTDKDIFLYFNKIENSTLIFHIYGLKADEIGISKIDYGFYKKVEKGLKAKLKEEPFKEILSLPYISVNKISMEVS